MKTVLKLTLVAGIIFSQVLHTQNYNNLCTDHEGEVINCGGDFGCCNNCIGGQKFDCCRRASLIHGGVNDPEIGRFHPDDRYQICVAGLNLGDNQRACVKPGGTVQVCNPKDARTCCPKCKPLSCATCCGLIEDAAERAACLDDCLTNAKTLTLLDLIINFAARDVF